MSPIIFIHTILGVLALTAGATNLIMTKGTKIHRRIGWFYGGSMYLLLFTSFFIMNYSGASVFFILCHF